VNARSALPGPPCQDGPIRQPRPERGPSWQPGAVTASPPAGGTAGPCHVTGYITAGANRPPLDCNRRAMDDDGLVARVAAGDDTALRELFSRHAPWLAARLRAVLPAAEVEDVLQET